MVTEFFFGLFAGMQEWILGLLPTDDPPEWITTVSGTFADVLERAAGLGAWFPFALMGAVGLWLLTFGLTLWGIKGVRWVWGLTPFSGGS